MRCEACGWENRGESSFCGGCGLGLDRACPTCGRRNPAANHFCGGCGQALLPPAEPAGERRQLTVMFCDLVGSTELSERLDPEELRDAIETYQEICAEIVHELGGFVAQYLGDGVLAYFGFPTAREHDAVRSVKAGLRILAALPGAGDRLSRRSPALTSVRLRGRIGIHSGSVVVGPAGPRRELAALGETPNTAARLVAEAEPGALMVSDATRRLLGDTVDVEDRGLRLLKGLSQAVRCWCVLRERGDDATSPTSLTPLVGREEERRVLREAWADVRAGRGRVVLVEGEPGIGKSRLVRAVREQIADEAHVFVQCRGSPFHANAAFYPLVAALERRLALHEGASPEERLARLVTFVEETGLPGEDTLSVLGPLIGLQAPHGEKLPASPEARRRRILEAFVAWLRNTSARTPVLLVVEDLQWVDPSTLELLGLWIDGAEQARVLVLVTHRPSQKPPFADRPWVARLTLLPLAVPDVRRMIRWLAGADLPGPVVDAVVERVDGIPLFVEAITRSLVETLAAGADPLRDGRGVPATLNESLMARLDRLGPARGVAQLAAVLGREFSHQMLAVVSELDGASLDGALERLVEAGLIHPVHGAERGHYLFNHALICDAAYRSLLHSRRRDYHARVAEALETRFANAVRATPELAAHHWREAGRADRAIHWYEQAGQQAMDRSAHAEAIAYLSGALELVEAIADPGERARQELRIQVAVGAPLLAARGYGSPDAERSHRRAYELSRAAGDSPMRYQAVSGLFLFHNARAELAPAAELAAELLALGEAANDSFVISWAHFFSGVPSFYRGDLRRALAHHGRAIERYDPAAAAPAWNVHEHDVGISALCYAAMTEWTLGRPDRAVAHAGRAVALGRRSRHPFNLGFALSFAALVDCLRRDPHRTLEHSEEAIGICSHHGFPVYLGFSLMLDGWARSALGACPEGLSRVERGLAAAATGTRTEAPRALALLAEVQAAAGRLDLSLASLDMALSIADRTGCVFWNAELQRLRGEALLVRDPEAGPEAERCLAAAIEVARAQGALSLELRAARSAAERLLARGDRTAAHDLLAPVVDAFSEGSDTPDLRDARALLEKAA